MGTAKNKKEKSCEIWKSPPSLNRPWFAVSNLGRARSFDHIETVNREFMTYQKIREGRTILKSNPDSRGRPMYLFQDRDKNGRLTIRGKLIRDLVAECFLPDWKEGAFVFNLNGDLSDCRSSNLLIGNKKLWGMCQAVRQAKKKIILTKGNHVVGEFLGMVNAAKFLGTFKQAVWQALRTGGTCRGCKVSEKEINEEDLKKLQEREIRKILKNWKRKKARD